LTLKLSVLVLLWTNAFSSQLLLPSHSASKSLARVIQAL
jgi:hypothetical protein